MSYRLFPDAPEAELTVIDGAPAAAGARVLLRAVRPDEAALRNAVALLSEGYGTTYALLQGSLAGDLRVEAAGREVSRTFRLFRDDALVADSLAASDVLDVFTTASGWMRELSDEEQEELRRQRLADLRLLDEVEAVIVPLLVARDYPGLERVGAGEGLMAAEIERQVAATGRTLTVGRRGGVRKGTLSRSPGRPVAKA